MTKRLFLKDSGIYQIKNIVTNDIYVGQTIELSTRRYSHLRLLEEGRHHNPIVQNSYNKYGKENFVFEIVLYCDIDQLDYFEQKIIDAYKPRYNIRKDAKSNRGHVMTDETKRKISSSQKGRVFSEKHRQNISNSLRGRKLSEDIVSVIRKRMTGNKYGLGRRQTQEEKDKRANSIRKFWSGIKRIVPKSVGEKISNSLKKSTKILRGEDNNKSVLSTNDVFEIRRLEKTGLIQRKVIGKMFRVSKTTINKICNGETWKHILG